ncbi:MAG: cupredoxin domain-containing protein [Armatimonadota bacterium]|nr:cupredoxin domain-containing protein [Armatimonadota bacterium]MDR7450575.1 cupredoxin domain-containing protein [Armatimonadota bacterium]MDR7466292.1 cupredoxin domain-containing protein [Armatimonadota bacterium]MDR7493013.1 cupredoxin domain-containing protein [Armatimonadota bacterium]MDR7498230.1 cupredoxin domain-containing protein [Armatimonadota bacterium]
MSKMVAWTATMVSAAAIAVGLFALRPAERRPSGAPTIDLAMLITGQGGIGGPATSHLYDPQMLVVRRGDTVRLRVMNQSLFSHAIEFRGLNVRTKVLAGGDVDEVTFRADRAGIFEYRCYLPYDPAAGSCSPDHERMIGHLVVLDAPPR